MHLIRINRFINVIGLIQTIGDVVQDMMEYELRIRFVAPLHDHKIGGLLGQNCGLFNFTKTNEPMCCVFMPRNLIPYLTQAAAYATILEGTPKELEKPAQQLLEELKSWEGMSGAYVMSVDTTVAHKLDYGLWGGK